MKNNTNIFDNLLEKTTNHLENKKYLFKPKVPQTYWKDDKFGNKKGDIKTDKQGNTLYKYITSTPHKNVMLSIAFNIALENYTNIRPNNKVNELALTDISDMLLRYFSKKFYDKIGDSNTLIDENQNYEYQAIEKFRKIEYKIFGTIERIRNYHSHYIHEPSILSFEDYFDDNSKIKKNDLEEANNWFQNRFDEAKNHLVSSLSDRKEKLNDDLRKSNFKFFGEKELKEKIEQIEQTLNTFKKHIKFLNHEDKISLNGQLFMATMFLYKRQAKTVLEKWRHFRLDKDISGYGNTIQTFFTYYCMSESYSINNYSDSLLKFRDITSKLTTIPYSTHEKLAPIYHKIREINDINYREIEKIPTGIKASIDTLPNKIEKLNDSLKREKNNYKRKKLENDIKYNEKKLSRNKDLLLKLEGFQKKIMPIRKRDILTQVLLQYLYDHNLFGNNIKIAIRKTITDRLDYFETHKDILDKTESLTALKNRKKTKNEADKNKREVLNEHFKELKRNFIFKTPSELEELLQPINKNNDNTEVKGFHFSIKKKNALIQYTFKVNNEEDIVVNITLSPQLLLKWVFLHLETNNNKGLTIIEKQIKSRINKFSIKGINAVDLVKSFKKENPNIILSKVLPRSIIESAGLRNGYDIETKIKENLKTRIKRFEKFIEINNSQPKPWQYASKQKIDIILEYLNHRLRYDVYTMIEQMDEDKINAYLRHNYFNVSNYDIARQYFRFFGRYKRGTIKELKEYGLEDFVMPSQIMALKKDYPVVFNYINKFDIKANSLEQIYNLVIEDYIKHLKAIQNNTTLDSETLIAILKINKKSNPDKINNLLNSHYLKSFALSDETISIKTVLNNNWNLFKTNKETELNGKPFRCSEYSFIRQQLQEKDQVKTNIDFIFEHILPTIYQKGAKLPYQILKVLLKLKTEELILWNIAKAYWKKESETYSLEELKTNDTSSYQNYTSFNKVYKQELDYIIKIDKSFWFSKKGHPKNRNKFKSILTSNPDIVNKEIKIIIKVPAKRYDNKFIKVETQLMQEYILWNHFNKYNPNENTIVLPTNHPYKKNDGKIKYYNLQHFDELIKVIYRDLKKSIKDIGALLQAEKRVVDITKTNFNKNNELIKKYKDKNTITDFYISFNDDELFNSFLKGIDKTIDKDIINDYLIQFRNYAIHYQLQDPNRKKEIILLLNKINQWYTDNTFNEYDEKE